MKVFILTEGGKSIGFGHITRCFSLWQAFMERGIRPFFLVNMDDSMESSARAMNCEIFDWLNKKEEILFQNLESDSIVIIDSYLAGKFFYEKIAARAGVPVYIDDNVRLNYPSGIIVNGSICAENFQYARADNQEYLLGVKYIPLRKAFRESAVKKINEEIKTIMVTFGGTDLRGMTQNILKFLCENFPRVQKKIILAGAFKDKEKIQAVGGDKATQFIIAPSDTIMRETMLESDLAITAAGQTLYELARVGVPSISVIVADNQMNNVNGWIKEGFIENAGVWDAPDLLSNIARGIQKLSSQEERKKRSEKAMNLVDGKGAARISEILLEKAGQ
ncbi:pseudaminic acid biosynthesis-associated protein PseG [Candidatus Omnitrophus magneticus]|uniref:Pseudaminic acid biosynthesis-associated protein PseG n=1 Tax=Candidatus Omnitrophus magneticus TaxID=1609969 RepID=A0A0F0CQW3_9BACT|nr:pseudaminic acid biosynthesis-associated protein PseG [Candidatus Omnitrophus magneticus]